MTVEELSAKLDRVISCLVESAHIHREIVNSSKDMQQDDRECETHIRVIDSVYASQVESLQHEEDGDVRIARHRTYRTDYEVRREGLLSAKAKRFRDYLDAHNKMNERIIEIGIGLGLAKKENDNGTQAG